LALAGLVIRIIFWR